MGMKPHQQHLRRLRPTPTRLLLGLLAIGVFASAAGQARGQQGLHVVPSPFINNSSLSATAAIADNDIWAVGHIAGSNSSRDVTLAEHFDGTSWSVVSTPSVRGGAFASVAALASNDVWAVGSHAAGHNSVNTLIEHWDGATWSVVASPRLPNGSFLTGIAAASTQDVWAVGDQPGAAILDRKSVV